MRSLTVGRIPAGMSAAPGTSSSWSSASCSISANPISPISAQFAEVTKLLPATGPDAEAISAAFGKKSKARTNEIKEIIETLKSLGKLG